MRSEGLGARPMRRHRSLPGGPQQGIIRLGASERAVKGEAGTNHGVEANVDAKNQHADRLKAAGLFLRNRTGVRLYCIFAFERSSPTNFCTSCSCILESSCCLTVSKVGNCMERTSSSWMTCQPNWVCTGVSVYFPFSSLESASAKGLTKVDGVFQSRSPPLSFEPGSLDCLARSSNFVPFFSCAMISLASESLSTRMWRALYSLSPRDALALLYSASISSSLMGCVVKWSWTIAWTSTCWRSNSSWGRPLDGFPNPLRSASCQ